MKTQNRAYEIIFRVVDDYPPDEQYTGVGEVRSSVADTDLGSLKIRSIKVREIKRAPVVFRSHLPG